MYNAVMLKAIISFILGVLVGAIMLYAYLWYQVYNKAVGVWCQIYTGQFSVEQAEACEKYRH